MEPTFGICWLYLARTYYRTFRWLPLRTFHLDEVSPSLPSFHSLWSRISIERYNMQRNTFFQRGCVTTASCDTSSGHFGKISLESSRFDAHMLETTRFPPWRHEFNSTHSPFVLGNGTQKSDFLVLLKIHSKLTKIGTEIFFFAERELYKLRFWNAWVCLLMVFS